MTTRYVSVMVISDQDNDLIKAAETLSRTAAGLALEGLSVALNFGTPDEDD